MAIGTKRVEGSPQRGKLPDPVHPASNDRPVECMIAEGITRESKFRLLSYDILSGSEIPEDDRILQQVKLRAVVESLLHGAEQQPFDVRVVVRTRGQQQPVPRIVSV